jgi:hypothetical protein
MVSEHEIDTQGLPPCHTSPNRLSIWEEEEVMVKLGKMMADFSKYVCKVTLLKGW